MTPNTKFKELRKANNLSQVEFAKILGVSQGTIGDIERGRIGISKSVKSRVIEKMNVEAGYFDIEKMGNFDMIKQGSETGVKQGNDTGSNKGIPLFPNDYWTGENFYLKQTFEKKLLLDIIRNYPNINELIDDLSTLKTFEFIIGNLNHYYFNAVILQFHSASNYLKKGKFDYDRFKQDYLNEVEKMEEIRPALNKIASAINTFYEEIKEFDKENIITGYFGNQPETQ